MNNVVIYDSGNDLWKIKTAGGEQSIRHALLPLSDADYDAIMRDSKGRPPVGYIKVNEQGYAFGKIAEDRGAKKRSGAARYTKDYYGISLAIMLAQVYKVGGEITAFCSHAPRDGNYEDDIVSAAMGWYQVEQADRNMTFKVAAATTFSEPVGGLMNVMLREDGKGYARTDVNGGDTLVIDIGGFTTDFVSVSEGGVVDYVINRSEPIGIQNVSQVFENSLRSRYAKEFKDTPDIPPAKLRKAITNGEYTGAGRSYDCATEAREAASVLLNRIANVYQSQAGGSQRWDTIILTGGGSAMLYQRLIDEVLNHGRVFLAEPDLDSAHFANVRGGLKLWRFYESVGAV